MGKDFISLEDGKTILNVNAIAMVFFPEEDGSDDVTCINIIGGTKTFYIKESFESVKRKLADRMAEE